MGDPGGAPVTVVSAYQVTLRFPPGAFKQIQFHDGSSWRALRTLRGPGGQPYAGTAAPRFGEFAATAPVGAPGENIFTALGGYLEFYGILAFVILFGAIAVFQEIRRRRHGTTARPKKRS